VRRVELQRHCRKGGIEFPPDATQVELVAIIKSYELMKAHAEQFAALQPKPKAKPKAK